jgi:hypothetical protein
MKIEEFANRVAAEALTLLEKRYHYRVSEDHKRDIQRTVRDNLKSLLEEAQQEAEAKEKEKK